ncbi:uncharacterized protein BDR25DRAFT_189337, partial [Lindgomyces ingoldianus]
GRGRVKRKEIDIGDGWTVVTHSTSSRNRHTNPRNKTPATIDSRPTQIVSELTAQKLEAELSKMKQQWKTTTCAQQLAELLGKRNWDVNSAVCIGIGSFSLDWEHRKRSLWQLVLFLAILDLISPHPQTINLYAQDPVFTTLDRAFLQNLSIAVSTSNIETFIKTSSWVFAPFVDWHLLLPVFLRDRDPVLYVGNEVLEDYGRFGRADVEIGDGKDGKRGKGTVVEECGRIGRAWLGRREVARVPEFGLHGDALQGLVVCWRKE